MLSIYPLAPSHEEFLSLYMDYSEVKESDAVLLSGYYFQGFNSLLGALLAAWMIASGKPWFYYVPAMLGTVMLLLPLLELVRQAYRRFDKPVSDSWQLESKVRHLLASFKEHSPEEAAKLNADIYFFKSPKAHFTRKDWWLLITRAPIYVARWADRSACFVQHKDGGTVLNTFVCVQGNEGLSLSLFHELGHVSYREGSIENDLEPGEKNFLRDSGLRARVSEELYAKNPVALEQYFKDVCFTVFSEIRADLYALYWLNRLMFTADYLVELEAHAKLRSAKRSIVFVLPLESLGMTEEAINRVRHIPLAYVVANKHAPLLGPIIAQNYETFDQAFDALCAQLATPEIAAWGATVVQADECKLQAVLRKQTQDCPQQYPWEIDPNWTLNEVLPDEYKDPVPQATPA